MIRNKPTRVEMRVEQEDLHELDQRRREGFGAPANGTEPTHAALHTPPPKAGGPTKSEIHNRIGLTKY